MILYEGPSLLDPTTPIVVIATEDENPKTGRMLFTWILRQDRPPEVAAYDGSDAAICGDCPFRARGQGVFETPPHIVYPKHTRTCYVRLSHAEGADEALPPSEVWRKWKAGEFDFTNKRNSFWDHSGEGWNYRGPLPVRIGSYGDPAAVPTRVWAELVRYAKNWTGYTHMWKPQPCGDCDGRGYTLFPCESCRQSGYDLMGPPDPDLKRYCMASVDTPEERAEAQALGWRTFMVVPEGPGGSVWWENAKDEEIRRRCRHLGVRSADILCPATDYPRRGKVCWGCEGGGYEMDPSYLPCLVCEGTGRVPTTCAVCGLCRGTSANAPSIFEIVHGPNKENHKW